MSVLSLDTIKEANSDTEPEEFAIPSLGGHILIKPIKDVREYDEINSEIRKVMKARDRNIPAYAGLTDNEVARAAWVSKCTVEPAMSFFDAVEMGRNIGVRMETLLKRLTFISGMTEDQVQAKEAEFDEDPFPVEPVDGVSDAPSPPPE